MATLTKKRTRDAVVRETQIVERRLISRGRFTAPGAQIWRDSLPLAGALSLHLGSFGSYRYTERDLLRSCPDCNGGRKCFPAPCASCDGWGVY
jgi:hypothetical protein